MSTTSAVMFDFTELSEASEVPTAIRFFSPMIAEMTSALLASSFADSRLYSDCIFESASWANVMFWVAFC